MASILFRTAGDLGNDRAVERQLRNWELARAQRVERPPETRPAVQEFVAISRQVGADGQAVAARLAEHLGWPLFDREILHAMAGHDGAREQVYATMDEHDLSWLEESLLLTMQGFNRNDYFHRLARTVLALARQGHAVFLGRGADLLLPRDRGLRVRIVASAESCARRHAEEHQMSAEGARRELRRIEREQAEFIRHHFRVDPDEPSRFDVAINLDRFSAAQAVEVVLQALHVRGIVHPVGSASDQ